MAVNAKPANRRGEVGRGLNLRYQPMTTAMAGSAIKSPFTLKKILAPIDFSDCSKRALRYAVALGKKHKAAITLLYVVPSLLPTDDFYCLDPGSYEADMWTDAKKALAQLALNQGGSITTMVRSGSRNEIINAAKELAADLIVICTHGRTGLKHVSMGSVAEYVVRHAPCPVFLVRKREHKFIKPFQTITKGKAMKAKPTNHPGEVVLEMSRRDEPLMAAATIGAAKSPFSIKKILVPIDSSDCAKKALQYAIPLAKEHKAALTLVYVAPSTYATGEYGRFDYTLLEADVRAASEKELAKLAVDEIRGEVSADTVVRMGSPAPEIIDLAKKLSADLIVISTHGRTGLKHVFLGSVAEHVIRNAPCPVLVVREQERDFIAA